MDQRSGKYHHADEEATVPALYVTVADPVVPEQSELAGTVRA